MGAFKDADQNEVEVAGVCNITEDRIGCWDSNGANNEDLAKRIRDAIDKQQAGGTDWGTAISIRYGKKNRVVVFKVTRNVYGANHGYLGVESVGNNPNGSGAFNLNMDEPYRIAPENPVQVRYETRFVSEDRTLATTTARLRLTTPVQEEQTIDNRVGATATFAGDTHTITAIKRGGGDAERMQYPGATKRSLWTITVKSTHSAVHPASVSLEPLDASGQPIRYADEHGNPVAEQEYEKQMRVDQEAMMAHVRRGGSGSPMSYTPRYGPATMLASRRDDLNAIVICVDPSKVAKFRIAGTTSKTIDIKDIRLDPR